MLILRMEFSKTDRPITTSLSSPESEVSLKQLLSRIINNEFDPKCSFTFIVDEFFWNYEVLEMLYRESLNPKQIIIIYSTDDFNRIKWKTFQCEVYFCFLHDAQVFIPFGNQNDFSKWDYTGKYVMITSSHTEFNAFTATEKTRKTQNIIGISQSENSKQWLIYINEFYWTSGSKFLATEKSYPKNPNLKLYPDKLKTMEGKVLRCVTFEWPPSVFYSFINGTNYSLYGMDVEIVKALANVLKFSIQFIEPPNGELWGNKLPNGSWNGLVNMLAMNKGDVGVGNFFVSEFRKVIIDYSVPYDVDKACFMVVKPFPLPSWQSLIFPFKLETWIAYFVSIFFCAIFLSLLKYSVNITDHGLVSLQAHLRCATKINPKEISLQIFLGFLWLYCIVWVTSYSSNLTAFLTVAKERKPIDSIEDLYLTNLKVACNSYFFNDSLVASQDYRIQSFSKDFVVYKEADELFARASAGEIAYIQNRLYLEYQISTRQHSRGQSKFWIMKECLSPYSIAMGLQKYSPLKRRLDEIIEWMVEGGLIRKWFLDSNQKKAKAFNETESDLPTEKNSEPATRTLTSLRVDQLQGLFLVYVMGNILACLMFLVEIMYFWYRENKQSKNV